MPTRSGRKQAIVDAIYEAAYHHNLLPQVDKHVEVEYTEYGKGEVIIAVGGWHKPHIRIDKTVWRKKMPVSWQVKNHSGYGKDAVKHSAYGNGYWYHGHKDHETLQDAAADVAERVVALLNQLEE